MIELEMTSKCKNHLNAISNEIEIKWLKLAKQLKIRKSMIEFKEVKKLRDHFNTIKDEIQNKQVDIGQK